MGPIWHPFWSAIETAIWFAGISGLAVGVFYGLMVLRSRLRVP